jgi:endonuclease/exonuclease/phosphatase (EEP) superfamily protein YafD
MQICVVSVAVLIALVLHDGGDRAALVLAAALLACIAYQLTVILPYTPIWRVEIQASKAARSERSLSLLMVNVLMTNREAGRLSALIQEHRPDVVLAVETDAWWHEQLEPLEREYVFKLAHPLDNTYGLVLYSKLELVDPEVRFLLKPYVPSVRTRLRLRSGELVTFYGVHPEPPGPTEADSSAPRDAELVVVAREVAATGGPALVAGDLNDVAWSHTSRLFRRISHLLDPRIGRGVFNTFHADHRMLRWPLDHVFVSSDFLLRDIRRLPAFGSDHFPILIALDHVPRAVEVHDEPEADRDDHAEADRKLEQVGLDPAQAPGT